MSDGRWERELVNSLHELGWGTMRCPSSGSATDRDLPDVIVGKRVRDGAEFHGNPVSEPWAVELKATASTTAYATGEEIDALDAFAERFGAESYVGARFKHGGRTPYYLVPIDACRMTDGGNYGVPRDDAEERADVLVWPTTDAKDADVEFV